LIVLKDCGSTRILLVHDMLQQKMSTHPESTGTHPRVLDRYSGRKVGTQKNSSAQEVELSSRIQRSESKASHTVVTAEAPSGLVECLYKECW